MVGFGIISGSLVLDGHHPRFVKCFGTVDDLLEDGLMCFQQRQQFATFFFGGHRMRFVGGTSNRGLAFGLGSPAIGRRPLAVRMDWV